MIGIRCGRMIGIRCGIAAGIRCGIAAGVSADPIAPPSGGGGGIPGVSRDTASQVYVPASNAEWTALMSAAGLATGNPSSVYLMQEASGNLADSVGAITLTATGASLTYRQAVTGWTRLAFTTPEGLASHNAQNTTTAVDISATSAMLLLYVRMPAVAPAAARRFARINSIGIGATITATPIMQCVTGGAGGSTVGGVSNPAAAVRPLVILADRTGTRARLYTDQEKITGTVGTYSTIALGIGASGGSSADAGYLYGALFTGAAAELSDAQVKTLLQTLNWTIPWT